MGDAPAHSLKPWFAMGSSAIKYDCLSDPNNMQP